MPNPIPTMQDAWLRAYCAAMPWAMDQCGSWSPDEFPHKVAQKCVEHADQVAYAYAVRFNLDPHGEPHPRR